MNPLDRPAAAGVDRCCGMAAARLIKVPTFVDDRGALGVVEAQEIPFAIERIYFLYRVPLGKVRGDHGHRTLQQVFIPMGGRFTVVLHDGFEERSWTLEDPSQGLYVPPMMWRRVEGFSADAVCLIVASKPYDKADYFDDFDRYVEAAHDERGAS